MLEGKWDKTIGDWSRLGTLMLLALVAGGCGGTDRNQRGASATRTTGTTGSGGSGTGGGSSATGTGGGSGASSVASEAAATSSGGSTGTGGGASTDTSDTTGGETTGAGGAPEPGEVTSIALAGGDTEKLDLLFVIDNSLSMADKQELFQTGVPTLVERLINPICVSLSDPTLTALVADPSSACPSGYEREFEALSDMHVGIVTTSLGGHGGFVCSPAHSNFNETQNDRSHLLPSVRTGLASYQELGFLAWDPEATQSPPGESSVATFVSNFQAQVVGAGESGCGYEAPLESMYRFLVEPTPPLNIVSDGAYSFPEADLDGNVMVDDVLLEQRAAFLRPDSVVGIVMLSDENDCSVVDQGVGWLVAHVASGFSMPLATGACASDPNSPCCRSCALIEASPPSGCSPLTEDAGCQGTRSPSTDSLNLRCYDQKRRFGMDLLYPVERYIDALSLPTVNDTFGCTTGDCPKVPNPLFVKDGQVRSASRVVLTGIVGVPWQDLATAESLAGGRLTYMTPEQLAESGRWDVVLGDPDSRVLPSDPLMIETSDPRSGTNPITGDALAPASSINPSENPINGHEYLNTDSTDLQYSCIFPLVTPRDCASGLLAACDCTESDLVKNRPLCNPPSGGAAGYTQYYGKAYPGLRQLEVIRGLGPRGVPASICPRNSTGAVTDQDFGYNPAVDAVVKRVETGLGSSCVGELAADVTSSLGCRVLEVSSVGCDCSKPGRRDVPSEVTAAVDAELLALCAEQGGDCQNYCACEIEPLTGSELNECMSSLSPTAGDGWCYISPAQGIGSEELVEHCPVDSQRIVRVVGAASELEASELRLLCF